ncbi:MAG TPA: hypothetical protein DEF51_52955, partial [Myxococcales bacterium]|nr:hypothetical protein [Myxococcales bacterium]
RPSRRRRRARPRRRRLRRPRRRARTRRGSGTARAWQHDTRRGADRAKRPPADFFSEPLPAGAVSGCVPSSAKRQRPERRARACFDHATSRLRPPGRSPSS